MDAQYTAYKEAVLAAEREHDMDELESALLLLRPYSLSSPSSSSLLLGLDLLVLLVGNHLAEFHSLLQLLPLDDEEFARNSSENIAFVVSLEQFIMEGSFNLVLDACNSRASSLPLYSWLLQRLVEHTIREEVAASLEAAYSASSVSLQHAAKMLRFTNDEAELMKFIGEHESWSVVDGLDGRKRIIFEKEPVKRGKDRIPAEGLIKENLHYATELEKIV